ncbi:hypothetical protein PF010_g7194 [Phytophthora fragariae]|uniref:Uncharacterized protein n=1 Tax=Phytophthora fragariae TaxID=53985 RepID=A0A6A3FW90_9STRA|nr:hypothetical protein PF009_g11 [Phytophthora fragariae]KAE9121223.1 hypothetical protein PF010_g7194 [Phytophthora fragariae]KAE9141613.1 hypothetical protein PF007_g121 [Phytophthora fragariae]KAE9331061.1 hypothetical protein PF001_g54 [Phytophthora fragariae]
MCDGAVCERDVSSPKKANGRRKGYEVISGDEVERTDEECMLAATPEKTAESSVHGAGRIGWNGRAGRTASRDKTNVCTRQAVGNWNWNGGKWETDLTDLLAVLSVYLRALLRARS